MAAERVMDHGSKLVLCIHYARDGPHQDSGVVNPFKRAVEKWETDSRVSGSRTSLAVLTLDSFAVDGDTNRFKHLGLAAGLCRAFFRRRFIRG